MSIASIFFGRKLVGLFVACVTSRLAQLLALSVLALPDSALACSVCFGDPDSPMTRGAAAGVYVMIGIIGFVLTGIASTACFWLARARRINLSAPATRDGS